MKKFEGYMRGINLGGWLSQCADYSEKHYSSFIDESDIKIGFANFFSLTSEKYTAEI